MQTYNETISPGFCNIGDTTLAIPGNLPEIVRGELKQHFTEVNVKWVDCPDLTQKPFYLAAPGICGDAILLEMGGMSQLFPHPILTFTYRFNDILKSIYNNHNTAFVIGGGIGGSRQTRRKLGEFFMDASFSYSQETGRFVETKNQSHLLYMDPTGKCIMESMIDNSNLTCYPHGNFFISEGKPGFVLKVYAKKGVGLHFLAVMQRALSKCSSDSDPKLVGLGGTFVMKKGRARHHIIPHYAWNKLEMITDIHNWLYYADLDAPLVAVGTLISNSKYYEATCKRGGINGLGLTESHFHAISFNRTGGHFYREIFPTEEAEYLGYFYPARTFHHIDAYFRYKELQDFNDIMAYWPDVDPDFN